MPAIRAMSGEMRANVITVSWGTGVLLMMILSWPFLWRSSGRRDSDLPPDLYPGRIQMPAYSGFGARCSDV
jgi:hypothetical protein